MTMRLSCGDHSFPALPHEAVLELIATLGFDGVNLVLWGDRSRVRPADVQRDVAGWAGRLEERVRGRGLEFADIVCIAATEYEPLALNHPDAGERLAGRALFADMLELTARLGSPGLTMLPGIDWPGEDHETSLARAAAELRTRVALAQERGVPYSIEPHLGSVCHTPADVLWLCEQAPGLTVTLDYTHYVAANLPETDIDPLLPYTRHFHARGGAPGRMQTSLKQSTIDYDRIIDALTAQGYDGFVCIEYVWTEWDGLNDIDVLSETAILRDQIQARLAGEPWTYPDALTGT
jgi:sugar phosphate isomerase/epimerase